MILKSYSFRDGGEFPGRFTCDGSNVNPPLAIEDIPREAKSLVLILDDPDATHGVTFTHWLIWNISPKITEIQEGEASKGSVEGRNDFGNDGYGGPCPPRGSNAHRYMFKLYALDKELELSTGATKERLESAMQGHILEQKTLLGLYKRAM